METEQNSEYVNPSNTESVFHEGLSQWEEALHMYHFLLLAEILFSLF